MGKVTADECRQQAYEAGAVIRGLYKHYKDGGRYYIVDAGWSTEENCVSIRYRSIDHPESPDYHRPLAVFTGKAENGAQRFVRYG